MVCSYSRKINIIMYRRGHDLYLGLTQVYMGDNYR